jgi:redox-sensing transcriptional repressor
MRKGEATVSSRRLAEMCHIKPAMVRKDFSYFGEFGTRGVGYDTADLINNIRKILKLDKKINVALVGIGNIGSALLEHTSFELEGFRIIMAFDNDPLKIGKTVGTVRIEDITNLQERIMSMGIHLVILAVPEYATIKVAKLLEMTGVKSILSFAPCELAMPDNIRVTCVDLSVEMARLVYYSCIDNKEKPV